VNTATIPKTPIKLDYYMKSMEFRLRFFSCDCFFDKGLMAKYNETIPIAKSIRKTAIP
jgi:hypothetical protein